MAKRTLAAVVVGVVGAAGRMALGRAGGGGSFHSGGGGGFGGGGGGFGGDGYSGGGGGSGGGGDLLGFLSMLPFWVDALIVIGIVVGVVVFLYVNFLMEERSLADSARRAANAEGVVRPTLERRASQSEEVCVAALREADSTFEAGAFYGRVTAAVVVLQEGWSEQNLERVRAFISDGVYERFTLQFEEQRYMGYRNVMKNVGVNGVTLVQVASDHLYDAATVRVRASAVDQDVTDDGRVRRGSSIREAFVEYWTFLRKRGATSVVTGLIEGNCPNCGAAVGINQNAKCPHCQASLRNGEYDWVLTEITQESEWHRAGADVHASVAGYVERDPQFTAADLEDRASVMFWRLNAADREGRVDAIRKVAGEAFVEMYAARFATGQMQRRCYLDAGVGAVETIAVVPAREGEGSDHAVVEVRWSGIQYVLEEGKGPRKTTKDDLIYSWYVLKRKAGVKTDAGAAISSAHCPNCGAPLSREASNACEYCNTMLTDGTRGWLLDHVTARGDVEVRRWMVQHGVTT